jgi:hypothetical protein
MSDQHDLPFPTPHWVPADPAARAQFEAFLRLVFTPPEQAFRLFTNHRNGEDRNLTTVPPPGAPEFS